MASITSLMNSSYNTSSIYGSRNILSGLASGMDTETMIENAVSGIKRKIQGLYQKRTKVEWQQEAYRSIIDKAVNLNTRYTSYTSKTNLLSNSFFDNAVLTTANGTYANKVSASGKTSSDIRINAVKQLATAASYTVSGSSVFGGDVSTITGGSLNMFNEIDVSTISGTLSLKYGGTNGTSFDLDFGELEVYDNAEDLAQGIRDKLSEQTFDGKTGNELIKVEVGSNGSIKFSDATSGGNEVYISSAVGDIKNALGVTTGSGQNTLNVGDTALSEKVKVSENLSGKTLTLNLSGTSKSINMRNVMSKINYRADDVNDQFVNALQNEINSAFGQGKIEVSMDEDGKMSFRATQAGATLVLSGSAAATLGFENGDANYINANKKLSDIMGDSFFKTTSNRLAAVGKVTEKVNASGIYYVDSKGNTVEKADDGKYYQVDNDGNAVYNFEVNGTQIKVTGNTTLESLMASINSNADAGVKVSYSQLTNEFKFTATETGAYGKIEFGGLAKEMFGDPTVVNEPALDTAATTMKDLLGANYDYGSGANFTMNVNGTDFSIHVDANSTIDSVLNDLNDMISVVGELDNPAFKGIEASFDAASGSIVFRNTQTGEAVESSAGNGIAKDLSAKLEASVPKTKGTFTAGNDAIMDVEVNGVRFENLSRSSNSFNIDGMTINVKDTFGVDKDGNLLTEDKDGNAIEAITFTTATDSDKIIDAIRSFVNDYNEMVTELKGAYSTQPNYDSNGDRYNPLTAEEEEGYTESQLAAYNEKAKQGILFGDTTLSSFYSKLLNAIAPGGTDGQTLREIGIGTSYENGLTTISLDEDKLRNALESDPSKVKNAFVKTTESGASTNGLMQTLQNTLNTYAGTTGAAKGVLINRAGSVKAPTSLNNNSLQTQINNIDKEVLRWQNKMSSQIDRYTKQFSKLEQLVAAMNSQASALAGLMGGAEGYSY